MNRYLSLILLICSFHLAKSESIDSAYKVFTENNLQGITNDQGKVVVPAKYQELGWSDGSKKIVSGTIGFRKGNEWGLVTVENTETFSPQYTSLSPWKSEYLIASVKEKFYNRNLFGVISLKNREIIPFLYYSFTPVENSLIATVLRNNEYRYGLLDDEGKVLISFTYFQISQLNSSLLLVENELNLKAAYDLTGKPVTYFSFHDIKPYDQGYFKTYSSGSIGLLDPKGQEVIPPEFRDVRFNNEGNEKTIEVLEFPEWKILNSGNQLKNSINYDAVVPFKGGLAVWTNGTRRILDLNYELKAEDTVHFSIRYDSLLRQNGLYIGGNRSREGFSWHLHDKNGRKLTIQPYSGVGLYSEGLIPVRDKGLWGFVDERAELMVSASYQEVMPFKNGLSLVKYYNQFGLIDHSGQWVALPLYRNLNYVHDRTYIYSKEYSYGLVNGKQGVVYKTGNKLEAFNQLVLETNQEGKYGLVGLNGEVLFETDYDTIIFSPETRHYILKQNDRFRLHDIASGREYPLLSNVQEVYQPTEGFFGIKANDKYGFVDLEGKLRISNRYDSILPLKNGLFPIKLRGNWGLVDVSERIVVQPLYESADPVSGDNIIVKNNKGFGILDHEGKVVINASYESITTLKNGHLLVRKDGEAGILDQKGNIMAPPRYENIQEIDEDHYIIQRNNRYGLINRSGVSTIPPIYDELIYDPHQDLYMGKINKPDWIKK